MNSNKSTLYIFSGLPATGKTTLAGKLAKFTGAVLLRIDTIEQGLRDLCSINVTGEGYRLSYRIAEDNLKMGNNVIADSCNPIQLTRSEWEKVANSSGANFENIEIICSDKNTHRHRSEYRISNIKNLNLPSWEDIESREYHPWNRFRHVINTANKTIEEAFTELREKLNLPYAKQIKAKRTFLKTRRDLLHEKEKTKNEKTKFQIDFEENFVFRATPLERKSR